MRQRRWLELIKDYDLEILYHPGKANVVADALSRKRSYGIAAMLTSQKAILEVLSEAHSSAYSLHPGSTKMYKDLKQHFWWSNMKKDVADHVAKCLTCQ